MMYQVRMRKTGLAVGKLEEEHIFTTDDFKDKVLNDVSSQDEKDRLYKRFIDDMIAAFLGNAQDAEHFVGWMNTLWPDLQFTYDL